MAIKSLYKIVKLLAMSAFAHHFPQFWGSHCILQLVMQGASSRWTTVSSKPKLEPFQLRQLLRDLCRHGLWTDRDEENLTSIGEIDDEPFLTSEDWGNPMRQPDSESILHLYQGSSLRIWRQRPEPIHAHHCPQQDFHEGLQPTFHDFMWERSTIPSLTQTHVVLSNHWVYPKIRWFIMVPH